MSGSKVSRVYNELGAVERKFYTGHEVFDHVVDLKFGESILILDETFSEGRNLLLAILQNYGDSTPPVMIVSHKGPMEDERVIDVGGLSLSDTSIAINSARQKFRTQPVIHDMLPDLLIRNRPEDVLRFIESWQHNTVSCGTIEFYLLPRGTFQDVERKIMSIVDGCIEIRIAPNQGKFESSFTPIRCCKPEWHLHQFPYKIDGEKLLIRLEGEFTDRLTGVTKEELSRRVAALKKDMKYLRIAPGEREILESLSIYDYWLLSQIRGKDLATVNILFPEIFDDVLEKIARWQIQGLVSLETLQSPATYPSPTYTGKPVGLRTKIAFALPSRITGFILRSRTGAVNRVPVDVLISSRKATTALLALLLRKQGAEQDEFVRRLLEMEKRFGEMTCRITALEHVYKLSEDASTKVDLKYLPKVIDITIRTGFELKAEISKKSNDEFNIDIPDCFMCKDMTSTRPICAQMEGTVQAICGVIFKTASSCEETQCKAMGAQTCSFRLRLYRS